MHKYLVFKRDTKEFIGFSNKNQFEKTGSQYIYKEVTEEEYKIAIRKIELDIEITL